MPPGCRRAGCNASKDVFRCCVIAEQSTLCCSTRYDSDDVVRIVGDCVDTQQPDVGKKHPATLCGKMSPRFQQSGNTIGLASSRFTNHYNVSLLHQGVGSCQTFLHDERIEEGILLFQVVCYLVVEASIPIFLNETLRHQCVVEKVLTKSRLLFHETSRTSEGEACAVPQQLALSGCIKQRADGTQPGLAEQRLIVYLRISLGHSRAPKSTRQSTHGPHLRHAKMFGETMLARLAATMTSSV
mmetsp:Transcript_152816/g.281331  ORF Transcript_152816/g.281331 Transcript_152816/m.281331 type:complete len:242 (+) Transcript_152816:710-1435(+)